jgi:putative hydrolase of the HAD superfamily
MAPVKIAPVKVTPVKAVLFDYGMVLSSAPDPAAWARIRTITGLAEDLIHREYWAHRHAYDRGDLNAEAYWHKAAAGAGIVLSPTQLTDLIAADTDLWATLNPPMLEWAQHLQRSGVPTGILSNMPDAMEAGLRARHRWIEAFDHHTWSHSLHLAKPEPAIYLHAAEGLHTPPENILFIDDRAENIEAALAVGMQAILYTTHQAFEQEMHDRGLAHLLQDEPLQDRPLQLEGHTASQNRKL